MRKKISKDLFGCTSVVGENRFSHNIFRQLSSINSLNEDHLVKL